MKLRGKYFLGGGSVRWGRLGYTVENEALYRQGRTDADSAAIIAQGAFLTVACLFA